MIVTSLVNLEYFLSLQRSMQQYNEVELSALGMGISHLTSSCLYFTILGSTITLYFLFILTFSTYLQKELENFIYMKI